MMPSQVYKDYFKNRNTGTKQDTYVEGDTGYVDLLGHDVNGDMPAPQRNLLNQRTSSPDLNSEEVADRDVIPERFQHPSPIHHEITPLAGKKHSRNGSILHSDKKQTPGDSIAAMFDVSKRLDQIGMTQLFNDTQAGSSSPTSAGNLRSDPVFSRPSPHMQPRNRSTSALPTSSPVTARKSAPFRVPSEPCDVYKPVDESQIRRGLDGNASDVRSTASAFSSDDDDDFWGEDLDQKRIAERNRRNHINAHARKDFASFSTHVPQKTGRTRSLQPARTVIGLVTPQPNSKDVITISSGSKGNEGTDSDVSVDEYDEVSQAILTSHHKSSAHPKPTEPARATKGGISSIRPTSSPVSGKYGGGPQRDAHNRPSKYNSTQIHTQQTRQARHAELTGDETRACVENSQPDDSLLVLGPPPRPVLPSSVTSRGFVSQSQIYSVSTEDNAIRKRPIDDVAFLDTSSIPSAPTFPGLTSRRENFRGDNQSPGSSPPEAPVHLPNETSPAGKEALDVQQGANEPPKAGGLDAITACRTSLNIVPSHVRQTQRSIQALPEPTIPETSPVAQENVNQQLLNGPYDATDNTTTGCNTHDGTAGVHSTPTSGFQTALSHPTPLLSHHSTRSSDPLNSPPNSRRKQQSSVRKMLEIAAQKSPSNAITAVNLDDYSILNEEDQEYQQAVVGPSTVKSRTRRRLIDDLRGPKENSNDNTKSSSNSRAETGHVTENLTARERTTSSMIQPKPILSATEGREEQAARGNLSLACATVPPESQLQGDKTQTAQERFRAVMGEMQSKQKARNCAKRPAESPTPLGGDIAPRSAKRQRIDGLTRLTERLEQKEVASEVGSSTVKYPNRVLAPFRGLSTNYYPATFIGPSNESHTALNVQFDDGTSASIERHLVKRLEFRRGDLVKLDVPGKKKTIFSIVDLRNEAGESNAHTRSHLSYDMYGYNKLVLLPKQRSSLSAAHAQKNVQTIDAEIAQIYITQNMFSRFTDRDFVPKIASFHDLRQTPIAPGRSPSTPSSRTRMTSNAVTSRVQLAEDQETNPTATSSGIFSGMAFCVSFANDKESEKAQVMSMIRDNGGQILTEGFDQLFERSYSVPSTPSRSSRSSDTSQATLQITPSAARHGFVALISDSYSRRTKYYQALALNLPCLHARWIVDSCEKNALRPWTQYLLPAGESMRLGGAVKSRVMEGIYNISTRSASDINLRELLASRAKFLDGKRVMLIIGKGKKADRHSAYSFLIRCAGAASVQRARDVATARGLLASDERFDLVIVEESRLEDTSSKLLSNPSSKPTKRASKVQGHDDSRLQLRPEDVPKIIADEQCLQSLIAGAWIE